MKDYDLNNRRYVIAGVAALIVAVYIIRLFTLQLMSDDYKKNADSNAFLKKVDFPSRGIIRDRNGQLLVFNQPAYDIMVVMNEITSTHWSSVRPWALAARSLTKEWRISRTVQRILATHGSQNRCS